MEIIPNVYQLPLPIPNNPLMFINAYLVKSSQGCLLIDTGWNTDESFNSLKTQLGEAGVSLTDIRFIAVTHIHPDHYGLVGRLEKHTKASLTIHHLERSFLNSRYVNYDSLVEETGRWLEINGVPEDARKSLKRASLEVLGMVEVAMPDRVVHGGEQFTIGEFSFEVIWTPGHSAGHICFYERTHRLFFSGDHILPTITPNVSMNSQNTGNPLVDYRNSLRQVARYDVALVLPGHGNVFSNFQDRIKEIDQHHEVRLNEMVGIINSQPKTAYQVAMKATWKNPWNELSALHRRSAVTETLAHLELLVARGTLKKTMQDGLVWYSVNGENAF